ncbi:MAG: FG-GAP repeat protein [Ignavibacteriae bacterium]|nr:FG-GAP repeat protein [Ignavibacteriota bacterium]
MHTYRIFYIIVLTIGLGMPFGLTYAQSELKTLLECTGEDWPTGLGWSVVALDDVNGDGWPDFGVNAADKNELRVYFGGPGILDCTADVIIPGGRNAVYADINGDGHRDLVTVLLTNRIIDSVLDKRRWINVVYGRAPCLFCGDSIKLLSYPQRATSTFGASFVAGDINNDGAMDLFVCDYQGRGDESVGDGCVYIYMGADTFPKVPDVLLIPSKQPNQIAYGYITSVGDVNDDGYADLAIGQRHVNSSSSSPQNWYLLNLHYGSAGMALSADRPDVLLDSRFVGSRDSSETYLEQASILDMNNDSILDIFYAETDGYIHYGSGAGIAPVPSKMLSRASWPDLASDAYSIGDLNNDTYSDFAVRAATIAVFMTYWPGRSFGINNREFGKSWSPGYEQYYGSRATGNRLAALGDVNGDGFDDVIVSVPFNGTGPRRGFFHVLGGNKDLKVEEQGPPVSPTGITISPVWPNPTHGSSTALVTLPAPSTVRVSVHDLLGRELRTLRTGQLAAGTHALGWDACDASGHPVAAGTYLFTVQSNTGTVTTTILVTR